MPARREEALLADLHLLASQVRQKWADQGYIYVYLYVYIHTYIDAKKDCHVWSIYVSRSATNFD